MASHFPSLPVELVALVIAHIADAPTLLNCLALSRSLQRYAERTLYADISFVLSLSHPSTAQLRAHIDEKDDGDPCRGRWSRGKIHGALALSAFRTTITHNPHLHNLPTRLTVRILSPFGRSTPFYRDLTEVLPTLTNLQHLDMRYAPPPAPSSSSPFQLPLPPLSLWTLPAPDLIFSISSSAHRARSQDEEGADFPALASAHAAPTSVKTLVLRGVCVPWEFVRRQRALETLELSGRMLDGVSNGYSRSRSETKEISGEPWHNVLKDLRLPHLPSAHTATTAQSTPTTPTASTAPTAPTAPNTHPDALTALFSIRQRVYTPARLGLDDAEWDAVRGSAPEHDHDDHDHDHMDAERECGEHKGFWDPDGPRAEVGMVTWVRTS